MTPTRLAQIVVSAGVVVLMVMKGFDAAIVVLAVLASVYVVGAALVPVWLYLRMQLPERPPFQEVELSDPAIPEPARALLIAQRDAFVARGFEPRGLIHQLPGAFVAGYIALYVDRATSTRAYSRVLMKPGKPTEVHNSDVELEIRYDNDTTVELSNVDKTVIGLNRAPGVVVQMPQVGDVSHLFDGLLELARRYEQERGLSERSRVPVPDDAVMGGTYHELFDRGYAIQRAAGLLRRARTAGIWRPTWKYAVLLAATFLSPGAEFFKRRLLTRAARVQRALHGDHSLARAERVGRWGWLMLTAGFLLGILAVVMAPMSCAVAASGMAVAWSLAGRKGSEPDWRALIGGGVAATVLLGLPMSLVYASPPDMVTAPTSSVMLAMMGLYVLPMCVLTAAAVLFLEGFRAAAAYAPPR